MLTIRNVYLLSITEKKTGGNRKLYILIGGKMVLENCNFKRSAGVIIPITIDIVIIHLYFLWYFCIDRN